LAEGVSVSEAFAYPTFEPSPTLFNAIEVWRIGWQVQQSAAHRIQQLGNPTTMMKRGIIQNHDLPWLERGQQTRF
jgi:hypothetical protein